MEPHILITGATGTTSQYAIHHLVGKGMKVRAMVRTIDGRSDKLRDMGIEVVQGDFLDINSIREALEGITRAYFCYPFMDYLPKAAAYFAKAAKEKDVEMVVSMSQMGAVEGTPSPATQNHVITENILDWANIGAVHIRPTLFARNYLAMAAPSVVRDQKFYFPNPEASYTIIHPKDIGEVVAEILLEDNANQHIGKKYELSGSKIYNGGEIAKEISDLTNQDIKYIPISVAMWIDALKSHPAVNDFLTEHLRQFSTEIADGRFSKITDVVKHITGHEPRSFKEYIREHKSYFVN